MTITTTKYIATVLIGLLLSVYGQKPDVDIDPNGYLIFCLCMGKGLE